MRGCCYPGVCWSPEARYLQIVIDILEFGGVIALILLNSLFLIDFNLGICYLDGYSGYNDLTVCYSIFWATVISAVIGFSVAILQCATCCFASINLVLDMLGTSLLAAWWFVMAVYWNYAGQEANANNFPFYAERTAVMIIPWVLAGCYVLSAIISTGRFISFCCCSYEHQEELYGPKRPRAQQSNYI
eukprot:scaffold96739_cov46-Prasinocladus_malaysianus.AAC.1